MHVSRIGLTPLKGTRHADRRYVDLTLEGAVGDRVFCFVDRSRGRVLRTVENPTLMSTRARWHDGVLRTELPAGVVAEGVPAPSGEVVKVAGSHSLRADPEAVGDAVRNWLPGVIRE